MASLKNKEFIKNTEPFHDSHMFSKMDFWASRNHNILLRGLHGVGKTMGAISYLEAKGIKYKYFSCSTLNPWLHFIGIPDKKIDDNGNAHIEFILPEGFDDDVEVIILDEYNRCKDKNIKNATMELLQFGSINGRKFKHLRFIIGCINPDFEDDEKPDSLEYDVEPIDPAQLDRFEIQYDIPYTVNLKYFTHVYGADIATKACDWWKSLALQEKYLVTPRRLDYIIDYYLNGGDVSDMLNKKIKKKSFVDAMMTLSEDDIFKTIQSLFNNNKTKEATALINKDFKIVEAMKKIVTDDELWKNVVQKDEWCHFWLKCMSNEIFITIFTISPKFRRVIFSSQYFIDYIEPIYPFYILNTKSSNPETKMIISAFMSKVNERDDFRRKATEAREKNVLSGILQSQSELGHVNAD